MTLVGYGFTYFPGSTPTLSYGIVVNNPSSDQVGDVSLNVTFYGADGSVVDSENDSIRTALPGKSAIGSTTFPDSKVTKMEVTLDTTWTSIDFEPGSFTASKIRTVKDSYSTTTTGLLHSTFKEKQTLVRVNAIYWNKSGRIIGGDLGYVDSIATDATNSFKISSLNPIPNVSKTEVYATP